MRQQSLPESTIVLPFVQKLSFQHLYYVLSKPKESMINRRQISLGDPFAPGGATYIIRNQDDLLQMAVEFEYIRLTKEDITITPSMNIRIEDRALREQMLLKHKLSSLGVPKKLAALLEIKSKSHAKKFCRNLQLTEFELFLLIHNCSQVNFTHQSRFEQYIPADRDITDSDRENLNKDNIIKFSKKLITLLGSRKSSHIHLFERDKEWHLFYYNYSDTEEMGEPHWEGPHLHYISHLWTNYDKENILTFFDKRKSKIFGYLHVRFVPFQYPDSVARQDTPISTFGVQPMLLVINSQIPSDPNSIPVPTAHVATRGIWINSISILPG